VDRAAEVNGSTFHLLTEFCPVAQMYNP